MGVAWVAWAVWVEWVEWAAWAAWDSNFKYSDQSTATVLSELRHRVVHVNRVQQHSTYRSFSELYRPCRWACPHMMSVLLAFLQQLCRTVVVDEGHSSLGF